MGAAFATSHSPPRPLTLARMGRKSPIRTWEGMHPPFPSRSATLSALHCTVSQCIRPHSRDRTHLPLHCLLAIARCKFSHSIVPDVSRRVNGRNSPRLLPCTLELACLHPAPVARSRRPPCPQRRRIRQLELPAASRRIYRHPPARRQPSSAPATNGSPTNVRVPRARRRPSRRWACP